MGIKDSDSIPTEQDRSNAKEMFSDDDGNLNISKMAHTIARLHRKESYHQDVLKELKASSTSIDVLKNEFQEHKKKSTEHQEQVMQCLKGDSLGMNPGIITMVQELHKKIDNSNIGTEKNVSKKSTKTDKALVKKTVTVGEICKFIAYIIGAACTIWALISGVT